MKLRLLLGAVIAALAMVASLLTITTAQATGGCAPGIGKKQAIVFVHGFSEGPSAWGSANDASSMIGKISQLPDVSIQTFDYSKYNKRWVTDPNIGKALAHKIACISESSIDEGGNGLVDIVAHSMGGDVSRQIFKEDSNLVYKVGLVVTIGTPNTGSAFDKVATNAVLQYCISHLLDPPGLTCTLELLAFLKAVPAIPALAADSAEMRALPQWPSTIPVYAIAGNMRPTLLTFDIHVGLRKVVGKPSGTDGIVRTDSALHGVEANGLGGTFEYVCTSPWLALIGAKADCEHNGMLRSSVVEAKVADAIKAAIHEYAPAVCPPTDTIRQEVTRYMAQQGFPVTSVDAGEVVCQDGWAVTGVVVTPQGSSETEEDVAVLRDSGSGWQALAVGNEVNPDSPLCRQAPRKVRAQLQCG